ncbi:MAG TPA: 4-(cytidine 5'-diphospho)-2-C-methyl-D-erythritol kinase [Puia sp.]|nr:4-(cytidine 5'-diphospho)-2-C-methyl-D-erythritol kinase [Puia sp.]
MIVFPHAKINLGLSIISKRPDGFHDLETVFYPVPLRDALEIVPSEENLFFQTGLSIPGEQDGNLVLKACRLLKKYHPHIKPLEIHLHKNIPLGAGLGGGSSDAAETIQLINKFFNLKISSGILSAYASEIGSDCPFFMQSTPCFATGKGEMLEPLILDISNYSLLLVHPETRIDTAWAFSKITPSRPKYNLKQNILKPVQDWVYTVFNDFELPVFEAHPQLQIIKNRLYEAGAIYASMTGSGSTIYGIFDKSAVPEIIFDNATQIVIR